MWYNIFFPLIIRSGILCLLCVCIYSFFCLFGFFVFLREKQDLPALVEPIPAVSTERHIILAAYFRNWDFPVPGSPTSNIWHSPRRSKSWIHTFHRGPFVKHKKQHRGTDLSEFTFCHKTVTILIFMKLFKGPEKATWVCPPVGWPSLWPLLWVVSPQVASKSHHCFLRMMWFSWLHQVRNFKLTLEQYAAKCEAARMRVSNSKSKFSVGKGWSADSRTRMSYCPKWRSSSICCSRVRGQGSARVTDWLERCLQWYGCYANRL